MLLAGLKLGTGRLADLIIRFKIFVGKLELNQKVFWHQDAYCLKKEMVRSSRKQTFLIVILCRTYVLHG